MEHDSPSLLFRLAGEYLISAKVIRPGPVTVVKRVAHAWEQARQETFDRLAHEFTEQRRVGLDGLLVTDPAIGMTRLRRLGTGPVEASAAAVRAEIAKLEFLRGPEQSATEVLDEVVQLFDQAVSARESKAAHRMREALAALAVLALCGGPAAQAAPRAGCGLPPIGAEIPISGIAINTPVRIRTALVSVDFRGGIKVRVDVNPNNPINSVRLQVIGFRMTAELPGGNGSLTIERIDVGPPSLLRCTQQFPPKFENILVLSFTMAIDQPDADQRQSAAEPLVLTTKDPAKLIGNLTQFPPKGDLYQLRNPVDLVDMDSPDVTVATIEKFPVRFGGL